MTHQSTLDDWIANLQVTHDETEKTRVYREYRDGEASEEEVREVFGKDVEEFEAFDSIMDVVDSTPVNDATDDLFGFSTGGQR